ncbi:Myc target protein 1 [Fukomys damarensis]|uniref:Myc target protein 1 n=1 Tax=Fukomys damarensis TaxID=885580 RepID=A0A091DM13_FUKDA|nr:Myc target protein 1 [Fukomys damarensis]
MQTQVYEGLCENYFADLQRQNQIASFGHTGFSFCLLFLVDTMANNTTNLEISWPENFWGKVFPLTVFNLNEDAEKCTV